MRPKRVVQVTLLIEYEDGTGSQQGFFRPGKPFEFELIIPKEVERGVKLVMERGVKLMPRSESTLEALEPETGTEDLRRRFGP